MTALQLIALSDLHIDKRSKPYGSSTWGERSEQILCQVAKLEADVLLFGGDMGEVFSVNDSHDPVKHALEIMSRAKAKNVLFYLGNNCLEAFPFPELGDHYTIIGELLKDYGIHLLDESPTVINGIGFVGNVGWYDASLFRVLPVHEMNPDYPEHLVESRRRMERYFSQAFSNKNPKMFTSDFFFEHCFRRLEQHLDEMALHPKVRGVVLGIHTVPSPDFIKYDQSGRFDFFNYGMGSASFAPLYNRPNVCLGLTGHTHRCDNHLVGAQRVFNISSTSAQPYNRFHINSDGEGVKVTWELPEAERI